MKTRGSLPLSVKGSFSCNTNVRNFLLMLCMCLVGKTKCFACL